MPEKKSKGGHKRERKFAVVLRLAEEAKSESSFPRECVEAARHSAVVILPQDFDVADYYARLEGSKNADLPAPIENALVHAAVELAKDENRILSFFARGQMALYQATFTNAPAAAIVQTLIELGFTVVDGDDVLTDAKTRTARRVERFVWPAEAPTDLAGAWRLLEANPVPWDCGHVHSGATSEELAEAEAALDRPLPKVLREALGTHNGIESSLPPYFTPSWELAKEWKVFWEEWTESLEEADASEWEGDVAPSALDPRRVFVVGREAGGHICYLLDASRKTAEGEHPVLSFDPETPRLEQRWRSLGHYLGWAICDIHRDPQKRLPDEMRKLYPST